MAKETQEAHDVQNPQDELEKIAEDASHTRGKTPRDIAVFVREMANVFKALKLTQIGELAIGTYFVPFEGQPGIEGIVNAAGGYMTQWVQQGWQPWQMANPYPGKYQFELGGVQTGALDGQWITIIWARPPEELQ